MPGVHHHILAHVCDEPGSRGPGGESWSWDCSADFFFGRRTPDLSPGHECILNGGPSTGSSTFQYQGGSPDEGTLILPPGTGIPVGGANGRRKTIIAIFHYPDRNQTLNGMTGVSSLEVTVIPHEAGARVADSLLVGLAGFLGPQSVGSITGSYKLEEMPIRIISIYTHWHDLAIDVQVGVERTNGETFTFLRQDPHKFWGIVSIPDSSSSLVRPGDRLTIKCTYNNTLPSVLRVE